MSTSLPQHDEHPAQRAAELEARRKQVEWDFSYHDLGFVKKLPKDQGYSGGIKRKGVATILKMRLNKLLTRWLMRPAGGLKPGTPEPAQRSYDDYAKLYRLVDLPPETKDHLSDAHFAYQRLGGATPTMLQRIDALPDRFPVTDAHFAAAMGEGDTLAAALSEKRAFLLDFALIGDVENGVTDGVPKYHYAPFALFVVPRDRSPALPLKAVAIQCHQTPAPDNPIFTPKDGVRWQMAKTTVQVADANWHGIVEHLTHCHMLLTWAAIAFERQIAKAHPLHALLASHTRWTLATGDITLKIVINPDGEQDRNNSCTLDDAMAISRRTRERFRLDHWSPERYFADRGTDDTAVLPDYPFRDDVLLLWEPLKAFVHTCVSAIYPDDAAVREDTEIQGFLREFAADDGGRVQGVGEVRGVAELAETLTNLLYMATIYHNAINDGGWPFMSLGSNQCYAGYAPAPGPDTPDDPAQHLAMLPPYNIALEQMEILQIQHALRDSQLARYEPPLADPALAAAQATLTAALDAADRTIQERNRKRMIPYRILRPGRIANSIQV